MQPRKIQTACYVRAPTEDKMRHEVEDVLKTAYRSGHEWVGDGFEDNIETILEGIRTRKRSFSFNRTGSDGEITDSLGVYFDTRTPTNNGQDLQGLATIINDIRHDKSNISHVTIAHADRLTQVVNGSTDDLYMYRELLDDHDIKIHIRQGVTLHCGSDVDGEVGDAIRVLAQLRQTAPERKHKGGRPPLGYTAEGGVLQTTEDHPRICRVLQGVLDGEVSKREAASRLGCARKTIDNAIERPDLYRLQR